MSVKTKMMSSVILFVNLFLIIMLDGVTTFHVDKPMIYINFFDEVVSDNASSKFIDKELSTISTPSNSNSTKEIKKKLDLSSELLKLKDENKTSASAPYDSIFEFDNPSKADITDISVNESDVYPTTTTRLSDLMDPEFLEPEITRMFFLKAIANLIEHIMEALFSIDESQKRPDSLGFDDYDVATSRNLKKRDLPSVEGSTKSSDVDPSVQHKISTLKDTTEVKLENKNTDSTVSSSAVHEKLVENLTEHSTHTPSTTLDDHGSSHHNSHKTTVIRSHTSSEGHKAKLTEGIKSQHEIEVQPDGKVMRQGKLIANRNLPKKPIPIDEDDLKMFNFSDEGSELNDEVVNKKDTRFYGGVHPAEDHEGYKLDDHFTDEEDDYNESTSLITVLLISTTLLILMILVAFGLAAAYFFRKNQAQTGNQNASNLRAAVA